MRMSTAWLLILFLPLASIAQDGFSLDFEQNVSAPNDYVPYLPTGSNSNQSRDPELPSNMFYQNDESIYGLSKVLSILLPLTVVGILLYGDAIDPHMEKLAKFYEIYLPDKKEINWNGIFSLWQKYRYPLMNSQERQQYITRLREKYVVAQGTQQLYDLPLQDFYRGFLEKFLPKTPSAQLEKEARILYTNPKLVLPAFDPQAPLQFSKFFQKVALEINKSPYLPQNFAVTPDLLLAEFQNYQMQIKIQQTKKVFKQFVIDISAIGAFRFGADFAYFLLTGDDWMRAFNVPGLASFVTVSYLGYRVIGDMVIARHLYPLMEKFERPTGLLHPNLQKVNRLISKFFYGVGMKTFGNIPVKEVIFKNLLILTIGPIAWFAYDLGATGTWTLAHFTEANYFKFYTYAFSGVFGYTFGHNAAMYLEKKYQEFQVKERVGKTFQKMWSHPEFSSYVRSNPALANSCVHAATTLARTAQLGKQVQTMLPKPSSTLMQTIGAAWEQQGTKAVGFLTGVATVGMLSPQLDEWVNNRRIQVGRWWFENYGTYPYGDVVVPSAHTTGPAYGQDDPELLKIFREFRELENVPENGATSNVQMVKNVAAVHLVRENLQGKICTSDASCPKELEAFRQQYLLPWLKVAQMADDAQVEISPSFQFMLFEGQLEEQMNQELTP